MKLSHQRGLTIRLIAALGVALLATGCSSPEPRPNAALTAPGNEEACAITSKTPGGDVTRYEAGPEGRSWWVSYAVLTNPCDLPATLTSLEQAGVQEPGLSWSGKSYARPVNTDKPLDAFVAELDSTDVPMAGYQLKPGESVQVFAEVKLLDAKAPARQVSAAQLNWRTDEVASFFDLRPTIRFCGCASDK